MSTTETDRPAAFPTGQGLAERGAVERLSDLWADATPTELLPVVGRPAPSRRERRAAGTDCQRVSTHRKPTSGRKQRSASPSGTKGLRRHLRAALSAIALAAAILIPMQLFAAAGISSARQAALEQSARTTQATKQAAPAPAAQPDVRSDTQADWVTEDTGAPYSAVDPAASPPSSAGSRSYASQAPPALTAAPLLPRFEHMYTHVSTSPTLTSTKEPAMRINPSDALFLALTVALLLLTGFVLGGLAAHPF